MGAASALQASVTGALATLPELSGVFHDAPARASFPYAVISCRDEKDVSCKLREGRQVRLEIGLWVEQVNMLFGLEDAVEASLQEHRGVTGWLCTGIRFYGRQRSRGPLGPWSSTSVFEARLYRATEEAAS